MPWCKNLPKHGVWHGPDAEPVGGGGDHEGGEQGGLQPSLAWQGGGGGQDGADAE